MKCFVFILFFLLLASCKNNNVVEVKLTVEGGEPIYVITCKGVDYFLVAEEGEEAYNSCNNTIVYKIISKGKGWSRMRHKIKGVVKGVEKNDEICCFLSVCKGSYSIVKWDGESAPESIYQGNERINQVFFLSKEKVFFSTKNKLFVTKDAGKTWEETIVDRNIFGKFKVENDTIYLLSRNKSGSSYTNFGVLNSSSSVDLQNMEVLDVYIERENDYLFFGKKDGYIVLRRYRDGKWKDVKVFSKGENDFPEKLHKYKNFIAVLYSSIDRTMLGGFGGKRYFLEISRDNGKKWERIELQNDTYVSPNAFYKDKRFIAYSGQGKIIRINFK